tara:strand:+ start:4045 stop:4275 length:231 start_codon:yes stop_codon:yes gene_type:complete
MSYREYLEYAKYVKYLRDKLKEDIYAYRCKNHYPVTIIICHPDTFNSLGDTLVATGARIIRSRDVGVEEFLCKSER